MKKQLDPKKMSMVTIPLEFDEDGAGEKAVDIPSTIHIIPIGEWNHDMYGPMSITTSDIREFMQNFNQEVRKGVFITAGHEGYQELPALGWMKKLEMRDNGLWADVEWNELGKDTLSDKQYKFFSPEFYRDYEDPQTHQIYRNVLTGGALTKSPYFKELEAVVFSDKIIKSNFNTTTMNLADLLAKDITTLTDEEKAFIKTNKDQLTEEQKTSHTAIIDEPAPAETEEEKAAREEKEKGDANEAAGLNRDGSAKEAAETVVTTEAPAAEGDTTTQVTASELAKDPVKFAQLMKDAEEGRKAFAELRKNKLDTATAGMMFSEKNKDAGKFLPKSEATLRAFIETLSEKQMQSFSTLVAQLPSTKLFTEEGAAETFAEGTAVAEVEHKIAAAIKASENKLSYAEALKQVMSSNVGLSERYNAEINQPTK